MDDWQLIQDYLEQKSETAFCTLVNRYIALVHSAALRQLGDSTLAEEVTQAVFILLARKAGSFRRDVILPGWLFRTTHFVASRAIRSEQRRRQREQEAYEMQQLNTPDAAWLRIAPHLDDAMAQLNETERNAIILRYFQGQELRQVGLALGMSEEAARKRISRSVEKLRSSFANRGYSISASLIVTTLGTQTVNAVSGGLAGSIASGTFSAATAAGLTSFPLVMEVLTAWRWMKLKLLGVSAAGGIALLVLLFGGFSLFKTGKTEAGLDSLPLTNPTANVSPDHEESLVTQKAAPPIAENELVLRFQVLAADNDEPVSNAGLAVNTVHDGEWKRRFDLITDTSGWCNVPYLNGTTRLDVGVMSEGWAARFATWIPSKEDFIPAEYILRVERVTNSAGGRIADSSGEPVSGATVSLMFWGDGDVSNQETPREKIGFSGVPLPVAVTDAYGQWQATVIPPQHEGFQLEATHPDFATTAIASSTGNPPSEEWQKRKLERLWSRTLVTAMDSGYTLRGRVINQNGAPIAGAKITEGIQSPIFETDANGFFEIRNLSEDRWEYTVSAEGYAPKRVKGKSNRRNSLEVQLTPAAVLRLFIVDEKGIPVPEATVGLEQWGKNRHVLEWTAKSDSQGRIEWRSAPPGEKLELYARKEGFCYSREISLKADGNEHCIQMRRAFTVSGRVLDSENGEPIKQFKAIPGYTYKKQNVIGWERSESRRRTNGVFTLTFSEDRRPWHVRIEAEGYFPAVSGPISPDFNGTLEFALEKQDPREAVRGRVLLPNGLLAENAQVVLLGLENNAMVSPGRIRSDDSKWQVLTDADGQFIFPVSPLGHTIAALHKEGFRQMRVVDSTQPVTVQLQLWGKIEGRLEGTALQKPLGFISWGDPTANEYAGHLQFDNFMACAAVTEGKFKFDLVPPGEWAIAINSPSPGFVPSHKQFVTVHPGTTAEVVLSTRGPIVKGQLVATPQSEKVRMAYLQTLVPQRNRVVKQDIAEQMRNVDFWQSPAGMTHLKESYSIKLILDSEGKFVSQGEVPPGDYLLCIVTAKGKKEQRVSIMNPNESTEVDIGIISAD